MEECIYSFWAATALTGSGSEQFTRHPVVSTPCVAPEVSVHGGVEGFGYLRCFSCLLLGQILTVVAFDYVRGDVFPFIVNDVCLGKFQTAKQCQ